jgi:hypothetical protein
MVATQSELHAVTHSDHAIPDNSFLTNGTNS